ncbi:GH12190 [Drosophila grimshawi]|uniref:GH12190 n=2 Tax=Drosophila grimshawi TaxID=7222 RepID=B4JJS8_DROGR|nr:GH12190 [Drosophila grimshawi]
MFFVVLGLSFTGVYRCVSEIVHICCVANYSIDMWRSRKFFVLDIELVRQARVVGAIAMCYAWMMMIYALINIQPAFMRPWLLLNAILLGIDSLICLIDVLKGRLALCLGAIYPKLLLLGTMALVNCVKTVFHNAIEQNMANELRVFGKESIFAKYN